MVIMNFGETNFFIIYSNPAYSTKVYGALNSMYWGFSRPQNIPHDLHSKYFKDVANLISKVEWTCFLWDILISFLDISIHIIMNARHRDTKPLQGHFTGYGGTL